MADITIEVYCECGNLLSSSTTKRGDIEVEPCEKCCEKARYDGYDEGYQDSMAIADNEKARLVVVTDNKGRETE